MRHRTLLAFLAIITGMAVTGAARADDEVSFDYFYAAMQDQGDWFGTDTYGYVFQPRAAAKDPNWRPYADGYWSFTDEGWTWISYEDFGWATYHYGRWAKLQSIGWVWVPGYEWAPAWVSWRTSANYADDATDPDQPVDPESDVIGWAPLPPNAVLYAGAGLAGGLDYAYDIPPENYCFVPTPYFCAPALIVVIFVPARNYYCFGWTVNVTHCHFRDHHGVPRIYCGGPNIDRLQRRVPRPIPRFTIERRAGVPTPGRGSPAILNEVRGRTLHVVAPRIAPPPGVANSSVGVPRTSTTQRPPQVKAVLAKAMPVAGWNTSGVPTQAVQAAREQLKREAAQAPRQAVATDPARVAANDPTAAPARVTRPIPSAAAPPSAAPTTPEDLRREQVIAEQQRRAAQDSSPENESPEAQAARRQEQIDAQQRSQSEAQARMQAMRRQQAEQARQAQANAPALRQQQMDAQRQVQAERQRRAQAEIQARNEAQREATRQAQQQAEQQRRAAEAQRRMDAARGGGQGAQGTQTP